MKNPAVTFGFFGHFDEKPANPGVNLLAPGLPSFCSGDPDGNVLGLAGDEGWHQTPAQRLAVAFGVVGVEEKERSILQIALTHIGPKAGGRKEIVIGVRVPFEQNPLLGARFLQKSTHQQDKRSKKTAKSDYPVNRLHIYRMMFFGSCALHGG